MKRLIVVFIVTLAFGVIYALIDSIDPDAFGFKSVLDPFYFSFTTMSTVGYGDYGPKTRTAKVFVMAQLAVLIGEVINLLGTTP